MMGTGGEPAPLGTCKEQIPMAGEIAGREGTVDATQQEVQANESSVQTAGVEDIVMTRACVRSTALATA